MKLKRIEAGMVIHCKTEEESKALMNHAHQSGYRQDWEFECGPEKTFFRNSKDGVDYQFYANKNIAYVKHGYCAIDTDITVIEFSDMVIQDEHMSTEKIIEWLRNHNSDSDWEAVFGNNDFNDVCGSYTAEQIIEKIEAYETKKEQEKNIEIEWVYRVYCGKNYGEKFFKTEEQAIKRCEELIKSQGNKQFARYERVCRIKESNT